MSDGPMTPAQLAQLNYQQRAAVLANAVQMKQQIFSQNVDPAQQTTLNVSPRYVGLVKGFLVEVTATLTAGNAAVVRTNYGSANLVKNFTFTDLNNTVRINAPGWFVALINSARQGWGYGGVYANMLAMGYGNNYPVNSGGLNVAAAADVTVRHIYYVPLAYSGDDLRGSIYAGVTSATMNLAVTINDKPFAAAGADPMNAIYAGGPGAYKAGTSVNVTVYQVYLDQIPTMNGGPILPITDLNTVYELKYGTQTGPAVGQDFGLAYSNYRDFLSTTVVIDNGGNFYPGTDVNYFALTSANFTNLWKVSPEIAALESRQVFMADPPVGTYYFNHRDRPINTVAFGNMELNVNLSVVNNAAVILVGYESFAQINQLTSGAVSSLG